MKILHFPLTKIAIGLVCGIIAYPILTPKLSWLWGSSLFAVIGLLLTHRYHQPKTIKKYMFGSFVLFASCTVGALTAALHKQPLRQNHYLHQITHYDQPHTLTIELLEKLKSTPKNKRFTASISTIDNNTCLGKIILNIPLSDTKSLAVGSLLELTATLYKNKAPANPSLFDYSHYLEQQEIYAQAYADPATIKAIPHPTTNWSGFAHFRETIIARLAKSAIADEERNVLNALLLGQQQDIAPDIIKDYQYAGAVHVLSVSGLHVGFIMLFLTFLLKPLGNTKKGALLKVISIVVSLWAFAVLTGLSPSIVRSAAMFSFVTVGMHQKRTVNIYHTLLVSLMLILLCKPSFLFDVGFQLSYLALFFIVWLQPVLAQIWQPRHKITTYFWDIITVSFAAQIGTLPLSLYYFHQFPGLFFVTNLLILPLLGLIMALGVIALGIAAFQTVPYWVIKPLEFLIRAMNQLIHQVASLDHFVFRNIAFSQEMLWTSYAAILLTILWIKTPDFKKLALAFASIIILQSVIILQKKDTATQEELIVFSSRKNTIITERHGTKVTVYAQDSLLKTLNNTIPLQSYLTGNFCHIYKKEKLTNLLYCNHQKLLIIDSSAVYPETLQPDVILLIQSPKINLDRLLHTIRPKAIIADGSNYKSYAERWKATCRQKKIPFHYTNEKGFYKI